jgi:hypothetical protein
MSAAKAFAAWADRERLLAGTMSYEVARSTYLAGYRAAQRAEAASRRSLAEAEAAIAEQVAHGGDAGDFENRHASKENAP